MDQKRIDIEDQIGNAVKILSEFVPQKTALYFPLISSALVWLVNRHQDWKKSIYSWEVWPDPEFLRNKPDEFILDFFRQKDSLKKYFSQQIKARDMDFLRNAFNSLYPIFGLKDPFLNSLFDPEIQENNFKTILIQFEDRVGEAKKTISPLRGNKAFLRKIGDVFQEIAAMCTGVLTQKEIQEMVADIVKEKLHNEKK
ncbi:MAG: hypothetical protein GF421_00310 [Candidatus Aminicenantes bacterium]|nr:hypothetical protein [Candidatus Aminicenantes bacterium]